MVKRQFNAISDSSSASKKPKLEITGTSTIFMTNMLRLPQVLVDASEDIVSKKLDQTEKSYKNKQEQELPELNILESDFNRSESHSSISSSESSEISRPQTPVQEQTSDNRHLQSQTDEVSFFLNNLHIFCILRYLFSLFSVFFFCFRYFVTFKIASMLTIVLAGRRIWPIKDTLSALFSTRWTHKGCGVLSLCSKLQGCKSISLITVSRWKIFWEKLRDIRRVISRLMPPSIKVLNYI